MRNEANLWHKRLSWHGGRRFGKRYGSLGGLEILEDFEGAEEHAVGGVDATVKAGEGIEGVLESMAERGVVLNLGVEELNAGKILVEAFDLVIPELRFDAAEASLDPFGGDQGVDERELGGASGAVVEEELGGEGFEFGGIFAWDDVRPGVDA